MQFSSVKQFETQNLNVPGAQIIRSPVYSDLRGSLYESFHILKLRWPTSVDTLDGIYPGKNTLYGPCVHDGEELLYLIRGKLLVYLVDVNDHSKRDKFEVDPGMVIRIPGNAIHAFYSLDEKTIFNLARNQPEGTIKKFTVEELGLEFPGPVVPAPSHAEVIPEVDYAILGANTPVGKHLAEEITKKGEKWIEVRSFLNQQEGLENELSHIKVKKSVLIAAGSEHDSQWYNEHHIQTLDQNVTCQLAAVRICKKLGLKCTLVTSHEEAHKEQYYGESRALLEKLLKATALDKHCVLTCDQKVSL